MNPLPPPWKAVLASILPGFPQSTMHKDTAPTLAFTLGSVEVSFAAESLVEFLLELQKTRLCHLCVLLEESGVADRSTGSDVDEGGFLRGTKVKL